MNTRFSLWKTFGLRLLPLAVLVATVQASETTWNCPAQTSESISVQGNTRIFTCLDAEGQPHGRFEVRAYADSTLSGKGKLLVRGNFSHGLREGRWEYSSNAGAPREAWFSAGEKVEENHAN